MKAFTSGAVALASSLSLAAGAHAGVFAIAYPSSSTSYFSATTGSGTIPSGGQSAFMWTTGDNISQTFTGTGLASVAAFSDDFQIQNYLSENETVDVAINGTVIGSFDVLADGGSGADQTVDFSTYFAPIPGAGDYTVTMTLTNTIDLGDGSIAFLDGGVGSLNSSAPEPATWTLMLAGIGGLGAALRLRRGKQVRQTA
jgi:hypothetical protein